MSFQSLGKEERQAFARELRSARAVTQKDSEGFDDLLFAFERLGSYLTRSDKGLKHFESALRAVAQDSPLFDQISLIYPTLHLDFDALYESVRLGRNEALHQGAAARHLTSNAQELALILEDALMSRAKTALEFMVRDPVCAETWQPLSAIRRIMLLNSFSYLPFRKSVPHQWRLISDRNVASFLRSSSKHRKEKLLMTLGDALDVGLEDTRPQICQPTDSVDRLVSKMTDVPYLVLLDKDRLCGIITAFDLL